MSWLARFMVIATFALIVLSSELISPYAGLSVFGGFWLGVLWLRSAQGWRNDSVGHRSTEG